MANINGYEVSKKVQDFIIRKNKHIPAKQPIIDMGVYLENHRKIMEIYNQKSRQYHTDEEEEVLELPEKKLIKK